MKPTLLVLAAGMGSRYGGLKQLDALGPNGETIIDYTIYDAIRSGFGKVVFVIRESFSDEFKEKVGSKYADKINVAYVYQDMMPEIPGLGKIHREKPWGTAHAVLVAKDEIDTPFAVVNADDFYGEDGIKQVGNFLKNDCSESLYGMVGYILKNTISEHGSVSRGVCRTDDSEFLVGIDERTKVGKKGDSITYIDGEKEYPLDSDSIVSMNLWAFHPNIFEPMEASFRAFAEAHRDNPKSEYFIPLIVDELIDNGSTKVKVIPCNAQWYGVTYSEDKEAVQEGLAALHESGEYPAQLQG